MVSPLLHLGLLVASLTVTTIALFIGGAMAGEYIDMQVSREFFLFPMCSILLVSGGGILKLISALSEGTFANDALQALGSGVAAASILAFVLGIVGVIVGLVEVGVNVPLSAATESDPA